MYGIGVQRAWYCSLCEAGAQALAAIAGPAPGDSAPAAAHVAEATEAWCDRHGVLFQRSPPYQHCRNSRAELTNQYLKRQTYLLLATGRLTRKYWTHAHAQAVYLRNITPYWKDHTSPMQAAHGGSPPDVSLLRVFGDRDVLAAVNILVCGLHALWGVPRPAPFRRET